MTFIVIFLWARHKFLATATFSWPCAPAFILFFLFVRSICLEISFSYNTNMRATHNSGEGGLRENLITYNLLLQVSHNLQFV